MEFVPHIMWWEPFVNIILHPSHAQCTYKEDPTQSSIFCVLSDLLHFHQGRLKNTFITRLGFLGSIQSQILAGTYSDRYFYSIHVLAHRLVLRQPHVSLKSFQAVNRGSSAPLSVRWCLGEVCCMDMGKLAMFHCHPDHCPQIRFILLSLLDGKDMSEHPEQWLASGAELDHAARPDTDLPCEG